MDKRLQLQSELEEILGTENVYFQPPESVKLDYPCIIYSKGTPDIKHADNKCYIFTQCYNVTVIYDDPDMEITKDLLGHFLMCSPGRSFSVDNLYHDTLTLYY